MSPIYVYECCEEEVELVQPIGVEAPKCGKCGAGMRRRPTCPAIITIKEGMTPLRSKGYKEGYSREYLKSLQ